MTVTLMVNIVANVGFMIISLHIQTFFLPYVSSLRFTGFGLLFLTTGKNLFRLLASL